MTNKDAQALLERMDLAAVVMLIENHWPEFCEWSGGEEDAEQTLAAIMKAGRALARRRAA